jgi:hypothetical protein
MTHPRKPTDDRHPGRRDRLIREREHDPYRQGEKPPEPTRCPDCGAVFHAGRWQWIPAPDGAHEAACPACRRVREKLPAGELTLAGPFLAAHRDEILHLVRNVEARQKAEHPLDRIMDVLPEGEDALRVTFTEAHLARGAGEAVHNAYQGELDFQYTDEDCALRVHWRR